MLKPFTNNKTQTHMRPAQSDHIKQAITRSMIQADAALNNAQFADAQKFYKYALQLSEMHFGEHDSVVGNLKLLLTQLEDLLRRGKKNAHSNS